MESRNKIIIDRKFNCSAETLFNWLIQPELIAQWFGPKYHSVRMVESEPIVGGKYTIELAKSDSYAFSITGEYLEIEAPFKLSFSFQYSNLIPAPPKSIIRITIKTTSNNRSHLYLVQDFVASPSDIDRRTEAWEFMLEKIAKAEG